MTDGTPRKRDAKRTQAQLLRAATEAFAEDGFSGTTVDDIAARSETTKRMVYYYFGSKDGLYMAVLEEAYRVIRLAEQDLAEAGLTPTETLRRIAEVTYDHHLEHKDFIRLVSVENIHNGKFVQQIASLKELNQPAIGVLEKTLEAGRASGEFTANIDPLDLHMLISSFCVFQVSNRYTFGYLFDVDFDDAERIAHLRTVVGDVVVAWATSGQPLRT